MKHCYSQNLFFMPWIQSGRVISPVKMLLLPVFQLEEGEENTFIGLAKFALQLISITAQPRNVLLYLFE